MVIVNTIVNDSISCKGFKPLLSPDKWLGDEIINYVFKLFNIRAHLYAALKNQKTDFFVTSLFVSKLFGEDVRKYNFNEVKAWVKKRHPFRDLFEGYRKVYFPVNHKNKHWTLIVVDFTVQTISYFDSYQKHNKEIGLDIHPICRMLRFLEDLASSQCVKFSIQDWKLYYDDSRDRDPFIKYAYQDNENDCGLYVIVNSEII